MKTRLVASLLLIALALSALLLSGCLGNLYTLNQSKLTIGTYPGFEPFTFKQDGKIVGFDVDLAREIALRLDLKLEIVTMSWDWLIGGLFSEAYDVIVSAMTITPQRDEEIDFIGPYFLTNEAIVVRKGSDIDSEADLQGKTVGVLEASTALDTAHRTEGIKEILEYESYEANYDALESGKIDALIGDEPTCVYLSRFRTGTGVSAVIVTEEEYGIGIKKKNSRLGRDIRLQLRRIIDDGTYADIHEKWFGKAGMEILR